MVLYTHKTIQGKDKSRMLIRKFQIQAVASKGLNMARVKASVKLLNKVGLHARPASLFVQTAKKFKSQIKVKKDGNEADAKSILGILSLGAECGHIITITAEGPDAEEAVNTLVSLVKNKFGEEE